VNKPPLPIDEYLPQITQSLRDSGALVLVAEPGAGKTTRVPPAILRSGLLGGQHPNVVMLQPRRIATRAAAERIAAENDWSVGNEVGYQVRFENRITARTRLRIITEAILTRQLLDDPSLSGVGCVILDEFHERSIHSDLAIALLRDVKRSLRQDLLIVVMSATLDAEPVATFLDKAPIIRVPGRTFPVEVSYRSRSGAYLEEAVADAVLDSPDDGHVLVFLPGAMEIARAQQAIGDRAPSRKVLPLHGSLPFEDQQRAIAPSSQPKIVLATNIAETSLTIDGVTTVIDSGLARKPRFDPQRGLDELNLERISQASAVQRAGRAGRTKAGRCMRLWTQQEHATLDAFDAPEIARVDLSGTLLDLHAWGEPDPHAFGWFDAPPREAIDNADRLLRMLGALDETGKITRLGKCMQTMPVHPRLARLLTSAADASTGATVAAILSEKDFVQRQWTDRNAIGSSKMTSDSDVIVRMHLLEESAHVHFSRGRVPEGVDAFAARQVWQVRDQLTRVRASHAPGNRETDPRRLVLMAYPDRVCRRRSDPRTATMVGGVGIRLDPDCTVMQGDYFVSVDPRQDDRSRNREAVVRIASTIDPAWLEELFPQSISKDRSLEYDADRDRVIARVRTRYLDLVLRESVDTQVDPRESGQVLAAAIGNQIGSIVQNDERLASLVARVRFAARQLPDRGFPTLDDTSWSDLLTEAAAGKQSRQQVIHAIHDTLRNQLVYPLDRLLEEAAPETIEVPTGSKIRLTYHADPTQPPVLAVRLQELFGLSDTPKVAMGRVAVLLHLLGPNYRPAQVTRDLASFWKNTYPQVRKDLRAQYPKHSWPDDPLTAEAIRGAKRRRY
jgi:ATP-dependent helicase HrpB